MCIRDRVDVAGGVDVLGRPGEPSRVVAWEEVVMTQPDVLVLMPCGFDVARTRAELGALTARPGWQDLSAVRRGSVFLTDASSYFNRPGPRLVDGLGILASAIHPEIVDPSLPPGAIERT